MTVEPATSAAFLNSIGVNVQWDSGSRQTAQLNALLNLGVGHIRAGGTSPEFVSLEHQLAASGIKTLYVEAAYDGLVPNGYYWSAATPPILLAPFMEQLTDAIEGVEDNNELDQQYVQYRWHPKDSFTLSANPSSPVFYGAYGMQVALDTWTIIKADPIISNMFVVGPTISDYLKPSPYDPSTLYSPTDYGAFAPYPFWGNTNCTTDGPYDSVADYTWDTNDPIGNIDACPTAFTWQAPFAAGSLARDMVAVETGYATGTAQYSVSTTVQAKYIPRMVVEYFRHGIPKTYLYDLNDDGTDPSYKDNNFGLLHYNLSPKPAYTALQSLISLLKDSGASFTPQPLTYSVSASPEGAFNRLQYVHDLLLQKSTGEYYLLIWHEVADGAVFDNSVSDFYPSTAQDLYPPSIPVTITLPAGIRSVTAYTYNSGWTFASSPLSLTNNQVSLEAADTITVLELSN